MKDGVVESMEQAQESAVGTTMDMDLMAEEMDILLDLLATKVESLKLVDKERGLYILTASRSKDIMVFLRCPQDKLERMFTASPRTSRKP